MQAFGRHPGISIAYLFGALVVDEKFRDLDVGLYINEATCVAESAKSLSRDYSLRSISNGTLRVNRDEEFRVNWVASAWDC